MIGIGTPRNKRRRSQAIFASITRYRSDRNFGVDVGRGNSGTNLNVAPVEIPKRHR
jgi:hypothetical protein